MGDYKYHRSLIPGIIIIENDRGERVPWSIDTLRFTESSTALPEPVRDMARGALREFGLLQEEKKAEVIPSDTITTIQGVKVYMDLLSRAFFAIFGGTRLFGSLSDLEKKIKGDKVP